jgi:aldehyde:ferredoxin oxidoreductase
MVTNQNYSEVLYIDLTQKKFWIKNRQDLFSKYIGGTGVATQLLFEECPEDTDPFSESNPVIFAVGPFTGVYPFASKTIAMFKSPLTGDLGESHAGGRSAIAMKMAGYGAIVIKGKSDMPIYLVIKNRKVEFKNANTLWGMKSAFTVGDVIRANEDQPGMRTIMRIGQAGEKMISYASVVTETYRHFGRLGLGAVFGSKMLKGLMIAGKKNIEVPQRKDFINLYKEIYDKAVDSPVMKKYHDLGTAGNIKPLNLMGALPTKNLKTATFDEAETISGESIAENYLGRRVACSHCPTGCIHLAVLREPYEDEPYFYKTTMVGYDYELVYSLGSMLGISNPEDMLKLIDLVEKYCLDAITTGVVLSWATEAYEKKLISDNETEGIKFEFGNLKCYMDAVDKIVAQSNNFYTELGKGVAYASEIYGGKEFALSFGKNEMAGYHTGVGAYIGFTIGARHSHLDNAGYSLDQNELINQTLTPEQVVDKLINEESLRQVLSSIAICFFARGIYTPEMVSKALSTLNIDLSPEQLIKTGRQILQDKYRFKIREGFDFNKLNIPKRIFETKAPAGFINEDFYKKAIEYARKVLIDTV